MLNLGLTYIPYAMSTESQVPAILTATNLGKVSIANLTQILH